MKSFILLFCIILVSLTAAQDLLNGKGGATFYYDVNGGGTCGPANGITSFPSVNNYPLCETNSPDPKQLIDYDTNNIVAIPSALLFSKLDTYCGKKIVVTVDGKERDDLNLFVWDGCAACNKDDGLGFSSTVFAELFGKNRCYETNIQGEMTWKIVDEQVMPYGDQNQENLFGQKDEENQENQESHVEIDVEIENNEDNLFITSQPPKTVEEEEESQHNEENLFITSQPPAKPEEEEETQHNEESLFIILPIKFEEENVHNNEENLFIIPSPPVKPVKVEEQEQEQEYLYGRTEEAPVVEEKCLYCEKEEEEKENNVGYPSYEEEEIVKVYPTPYEEEYVVPVYPTPEEESVVILYPTHEEEQHIPIYPTPEEQPVIILYPAHEEEPVIPLYSAPEEEEVTYNPPGNVLYPLEPEEEEEYQVIYIDNSHQ